ncbi:MAG: lipid II flippase MurJ [Acidimicrobiales bacterium]
MTEARPGGTGPAPRAGERLNRDMVAMAAGTTLSRLTGFARVATLVFVLGSNRLSGAYNIANNTPKMVFDLLLGGVIAATLVPVLVDRLATRTEEEAWSSISAVMTVAGAVLAIGTALFVLAAPIIIDAYMAFTKVGPAATDERHVATFLLRLFAPQLAFYGWIALTTSLLNVRRHFAAPMFAPVVTNLVVIAVLGAISLLPSLSIADAAKHGPELWLLGAGTSLGVLAQAVTLWVVLRRTGSRLRFRLAPADPAVAQIARLSGWILAFVAASQVSLFVILALANRSAGGVTDFNNAYTFFQLPFGVLAVSIMGAMQPDMAQRWSLHDASGFKQRLSFGLGLTLAAVLPATAAYAVLSGQVVDLILLHGRETAFQASATASALLALAIGLPGFSVYQFCVRSLQAMRNTRDAFLLSLLRNVLTVLGCVLSYRSFGVSGLCLALSAAYSVAAVAGVGYIFAKTGPAQGPAARLALSALRSAAATAVMVAAMWLLQRGLVASGALGLPAGVLVSLGGGMTSYVAVSRMLGGSELAWFTTRGTGTPR